MRPIVPPAPSVNRWWLPGGYPPSALLDVAQGQTALGVTLVGLEGHRERVAELRGSGVERLVVDRPAEEQARGERPERQLTAPGRVGLHHGEDLERRGEAKGPPASGERGGIRRDDEG